MKKTMLTYRTLDRFEEEYKTEQYSEPEIEKIEHAAYVANMNTCAHPEWAEDDIFSDFLRVLGIDHIETAAKADELPALQFERRGCEFFAGDPDNEESDIGNYRITTPGEIVPLKDGRMMLFEFGCYDLQIWRYHNKRTGEKLKKPVLDSVFTCAMRIDTEYSKPEKTGDYEWRSSWRDLNMENEFYKTPRKYTEKNILDYVNSVSAVQYGRIEYV